MKILLVDPPYQRIIGFYRFYFPLGLTYIAAVLKQAGHEVLIYDAEHDTSCISPPMKDTARRHQVYLEALNNNSHPIWQEFNQIFNKFQPDILGISVLSVKVASAAQIIRLAKKINKKILIIAGGDHVIIRPNDLLRAGADHIVSGEGERGIIQLIRTISEGGNPPQVIFSPLIEELDALPFPSIDSLTDLTTYRPIDLGLMITDRGCPFECTFCGLSAIWGHRVRHHSIDRAISEIIERKNKYGTNYFSFRNGTFTLYKKRVLEFCQRIHRERLNIEWECLTRIDAIDKHLLNSMRRAGCNTIRVGIESGSQEILDYMNKDLTLEQIRQGSEILNQSGLFWAAYFMLGVPEETEKTIKSTIDLIKEIDPPFVSLAKFTPLPGTIMYQDVVNNGLLDEEATDWTWAANQSLDRAFVKHMDQNKFLSLMNEAAEFVKERNAKHSSQHQDARLKI